jgi:hypothetical protein
MYEFILLVEIIGFFVIGINEWTMHKLCLIYNTQWRHHIWIIRSVPTVMLSQQAVFLTAQNVAPLLMPTAHITQIPQG